MLPKSVEWSGGREVERPMDRAVRGGDPHFVPRRPPFPNARGELLALSLRHPWQSAFPEALPDEEPAAQTALDDDPGLAPFAMWPVICALSASSCWISS
jgi:hypothetical protein